MAPSAALLNRKAYFKVLEEEKPRQVAGLLSNSAFAPLAGLFAWLLRLLPRALPGLLTLLVRLVALPALLGLALVVLAHVNLQIVEI